MPERTDENTRRIGSCHRDPEICGESGCCWINDLGTSHPCPHVSVKKGLLTCRFTRFHLPGQYWGSADEQDKAVERYMRGKGDIHHFCKRFPWHPSQIGAQDGCGFDFICSKCDESFRDHPIEDLVGECSLG